MIAILDAAYAGEASVAACLTADDWTSPAPIAEFTHRAGRAEEYAPGEFHRRELPLIMSVLAMLPERPRILVIDGYVWLDTDGRKGLGAHLFEALRGRTAVVGVAKSRFAGAEQWVEQVTRGDSTSPLWVTCAGVTLSEAVSGLKRMHGAHRIPTLVGRVDQLARKTL
ncbi:MAG: endonuclease V [Hyphomonadaceae bacterium]|nr:endonuclease V [Hyphomonadaceae bacterium]